MEMIFVAPKPGMKVMDPATNGFLPEEGKRVPRTAYWLRRVACGDVIVEVKVSPAVVQEEKTGRKPRRTKKDTEDTFDVKE
jgi:hypothetical protein